MREIKLRAWHIPEKKLYFRAYQKLTHVLLCDPINGDNDDQGKPVRKANYDDCLLLECTDLIDVNGRAIFEGDEVRIKSGSKEYTGFIGNIPDMFRSRKLHPLHDLLEHLGIQEKDILSIEVIGNQFKKKT